jgi:hypothetical protein
MSADIIIPAKEASEVFSGDTERFVMEEEGEWVQDHKYQSCTNILKDTSTGKFYSATAGRSGSYHTDWTYDWEYGGSDLELYEVTKVTETITREVWK